MKIRNSVETENIKIEGLIHHSIQVINMADAQVALILRGSPSAGQVLLTGSRLVCDAESSGTEKLLLPPATDADVGLEVRIFNSGGESILVRDSADVAVQTLATNRHADFIWGGESWGVFLSAAS